MATFQKVKLGDVADMRYGTMPLKRKVGSGNYEIFSGYRYSDKYPESNCKKGDVVIVARGVGGTGDVKIARCDCYLTNLSIQILLDHTKVNNKYFYYKYLLKTLRYLDTGSAQSQITINNLENLQVDLPDLPTQTCIASVLSAYDDLIENNEKRIKALEEMAQLLYTEWFVKFKFPGHEKVKMVDSGTEYGMVPEGWEVVNIGDLLEIVKRKIKLQTNEYHIAGLCPIVDQGKDFIAGYTDNEDAIYNENLIVFGDHTRCLKFCNFPFACGADGTQLLKTNDTERMPQTLLYYSVINADIQNYSYARHFKFLKALNILKPDMVTAKSFDKVVSQTYEQIKQLRQQNVNAGKIRDFLIPQLVTGKRILKEYL